MRRVSLKRQALLKRVGPVRAALREEIGRCERCRKRQVRLHELTQGFGKRYKALGDRSLIVGLCDTCHALIHSMGCAGKIECLAILKTRRPADYCLQRFWEMNGKRWPEPEEVAAAAKVLE